jgi:hypothetical protein
MARILTAIADGSGSVASEDGCVRGRGCRPSELIVHYFLNDLSPAERTNLTDHLSGCDLCSARLLALEIAAELSVAGLPSDSESTLTDPGRYANTPRRARKVMSSRRNCPRGQRAAMLSVVPLDDRELTTTMGLALDFGALAGVPEVKILETSGACLPFEPREHHLRGGTGVSPSGPYLWDLAIDEIYGTGSSRPVRVTGDGPHAAA